MKASLQRMMLVASAAFLMGSLAGRADAQIDLAQSRLTATSKQMNVPVEGTFKKFSAQLSFDPAKPAAGTVQASVDMASYDLGDESYNDEVRDKEWFDAKTYPTATFVSSAIAPAGQDQFNVTGKLTLKGKSQTVVVPVKLSTQGAAHAFDGAFTIKRLQFDIGTGEWKDTSTVADDIVIKFHIVSAAK
ncbi:MAG TPA: YceI family protein [Paraburkholderia sp.]|nr:YceI family protein [Paraburkholderia sp.]